MRNFLLGAVALGTLTTAALVQTAPAHAAIVKDGRPAWYFTNIGSEDSTGDSDSLANKFIVSATVNAGKAFFRFYNEAGKGIITQAAITYLPGGTSPFGSAFTFEPTDSSGGVDFVNAGPKVVPQFNPEFGPFDLTADRKSQGGVNNGVNTGEYVSLSTTYSGTLANLVALFESHAVVAGIHVQQLDPNGNGSDSYTTIPTPALLPALVGLGVGAFRKRKQQEAAE